MAMKKLKKLNKEKYLNKEKAKLLYTKSLKRKYFNSFQLYSIPKIITKSKIQSFRSKFYKRRGFARLILYVSLKKVKICQDKFSIYHNNLKRKCLYLLKIRVLRKEETKKLFKM